MLRERIPSKYALSIRLLLTAWFLKSKYLKKRLQVGFNFL